MLLLFDVERGPDGYPRVTPPAGKPPPSPRQAFARQCYLNGVTDPAAVESLWREREAKEAEKEPRRGRRR